MMTFTGVKGHQSSNVVNYATFLNIVILIICLWGETFGSRTILFINQTSLVNIYVENAANLQSRAGQDFFGGVQANITRSHVTKSDVQYTLDHPI